MFKPIIYNTKAKVILLRSGHYRRVVDITTDDIEAFASLEAEILSALNPISCKCCTKNNVILAGGTPAPLLCEHSPQSEPHSGEDRGDGACPGVYPESGSGILPEPCYGPFEDASIKDIGVSYEDRAEAFSGGTPSTYSRVREGIPEGEKNFLEEDVNINEGVKVSFYLNNKDKPVGAIAKIDFDKKIIILTRKYMNRFFPVKLITKLVTNENELIKYKENIFNDKEDITCCIVLHAKNFQKPIGIEFKNKNIKKKFVDSLTDIYNMYTRTPTSIYDKFILNAVFKTRIGKKPFSNSLINQEGASHITELINERIRISKPGPNRLIIDPKLLYISNVDIEITNGALENFFHHIFGPITVTAHLEKCKFTKRHKGFGKLCFKSAELATIAMLEYNGVKLGRKCIVLSEFMYSSKKHDIQNSKIKNSAIIMSQTMMNGGGDVKETN